jgi:hypothetical protein
MVSLYRKARDIKRARWASGRYRSLNVGSKSNHVILITTLIQEICKITGIYQSIVQPLAD